jgi:hypothetical protein
VGEAGLGAGGDVILDQPVQAFAVAADEQRPASAAIRVGAGLVVLDRAVGGQDVVPAPAGGGAAPVVVVGAVAADPDHGIDAGGSAQDAAAGDVVALAVQAGVGFGLIHPVDGGVVEELAVAERHLDEEAPVGAAGLDQGDAVFAVFGQAVGERTACAAGADDDVVGFVHGPVPAEPAGGFTPPDPRGIFEDR